MKNKCQLIILTMLVFCLPKPSSAFLGFGDIVSDPASYAYYAEQLTEAKKQYDEIIKQYQELQRNTQEIVAVKNSLEATYNTVTNLDEVIKDMGQSVLNDAEYTGQSFTKDVEGFSSRNKHSRGKQKDWMVVEGAVNEAWGLTSQGSPNGASAGSKYTKHRARQLMLKESLVGASTVLKGWGKRKDRIGKLTDKLEKKMGQAEQAAFSNRLLLELIYGQQDLIRLFAFMAQASAAQDYEGAPTQAALNARIKRIKNNQNITYSSGGLAKVLMKGKHTPESLLNY